MDHDVHQNRGSQEERISILRLALDHQGTVAHDNHHYDLMANTEPGSTTSDGSTMVERQSQFNIDEQANNISDDNGLYL